MARYAMVYMATEELGFVVNVIEWDGNTETWLPPEGYTMVEDTENAAGPGFTYEDGEFIPPPPGGVPVP